MGGVLLLDAHLKQALVVTRSLGDRGIPVTAGSHCRWTPSRFSKHAEEWLHYPDPEDSEAFLEAIESELTVGDYDMLLPIEESTLDVVLGNRETFEALTTLSFPPTETTAVGLDKRRTIEAARRHDVPHPETVFSDSATIPEIESALSYPIVIKPINGEGRDGVSVCHSREALRTAAQETIDELGPVLFQEFIPNGGECGVYALYDHSSDLRAVTVQRRLRSKPPEGGASTYRETVEDPSLIALADEFLSALDWQGVVMAEFRVDPRSGEPQLMEINPRFWGSLALSVFADVDFPSLLYRLSTGGELPSELSYRRDVQARCLFTDFVQLLQREDTARAFREFLTPASKPCCFDIVSTDDPLPTVGQMLYWSSLLLADRPRIGV